MHSKTNGQVLKATIITNQQEMAKFKEYKNSLINSLVTGKVRVC